MLDKIVNALFSTRMTAVLLLIFALAVGGATFIETIYDTAAAQSVVYRSKWLELVLLLLTLNLVANIFRYKLYRKEKAAILMFHLSFIVILIGAGVTRYIGYEGVMRIREGETATTIVSDEIFLQVKIDNQEKQIVYPFKVTPNELRPGYFNADLVFQPDQRVAGKEFELHYKEFIKNAVDTVQADPEGGDVLELITSGHSGRVSVYIKSGDTKMIGDYPVSFNDDRFTAAIQLNETDTGLVVSSPYDIQYMKMDGGNERGLLERDTTHAFPGRTLYTIDQTNIVLKQVHEQSKVVQFSAPKEREDGMDALVVDIHSETDSRELLLYGGKGSVSQRSIIQMDGLNLTLSFGSKVIPVPFGIRLNDFQLDRYPGTMNPSSFASEVTLIDEANGINRDQRIFMNNVLDYGGYRFFQSSYDQDELGTVLSVNHDRAGTWITYLGYGLMILGMILTIMTRKSRFSSLRKKLEKLRSKAGAIVALVVTSGLLTAQAGLAQQDLSDYNYKPVSQEHAEKFAMMPVQSKDGRMKPAQTLASEFLRKVSKKNSWDGLTPEQVLLGMIENPVYWQQVDMIRVGHEQLQAKIGTTEKRVAYVDLFDENQGFIFADEVEVAFRKEEKNRSKYDKELLKLTERLNICLQVYQDGMLAAFPVDGDESKKWYLPTEIRNSELENRELLFNIFQFYRESLMASVQEDNFAKADTALTLIKTYQKKISSDIIPSESKMNMEINYNKWQVFNKLFYFYFIVGFIFLIPLFIDIVSNSKLTGNKWIIRGIEIILLLATILHGIALGMRWFIAEHAPWSNAYEALTYIAFMTMVAGFIFSRGKGSFLNPKSKMTLAATTILAGMTLMVAHLNWLDPDIGTLVPVLKSYWLMIHVAVITASYAFLGLSAILGLVVMVLYVFRNSSNKRRIDDVVAELTINNELSMTVGVFTAAIGTFLGGIWANESWGRYWGWDSKETWALVIVLVYAMVLHFRLIPKMNGKYTFNLWSIWSYSTVLMTFFGVNYYLTGLHSYAGGDTPPIPGWVIPTVLLFVVLSVLAYIRKNQTA